MAAPQLFDINQMDAFFGPGEASNALMPVTQDAYEPQGNRGFRPLTENEVKGALSREILDSHGAISAGSQISEERRQALKFFFGQPLGNEIEGRSKVVLTEVADTIHWMMPSLMRMFASGEDIFDFAPVGKEDIEGAEQANEYINHYFWNEMDGYQLLYDWFFTALLEKNGFVCVDWEERVEPKRESYDGLTAQQLDMLLNDGRNLEVVEFQERQVTIPGPQGPVQIGLFDVTVVQNEAVGKMVARGIPPEEFLIARRSIRLDDDVQFVGERRKMTASDLIAMGFDPAEVETWPTDESPEFSQGRTIRLSEEETFPLQTADRPDAASREMWVNSCYMRIDEDGDGYAELRHLMCIGDTAMTLLYDDYADYPPYASLTASPVPHKFFGQSVHDLVGDLQEIRTTLMRQLLDNLYLQNNQRNLVVKGEANLNDLLTSRPGGIVRVDNPEAVTPLVTPPLSPVAMGMMEYLDQIREIRVGVSRWTQGLDGSSLNGTATGVNAMMGASQQRIELIGRIFAQTGMKRLGKLLLRTFKKNDLKKRMVRMRGEWKEIDPSLWNENMDCKIKTGLGVGSANERIAHLMATISLQEKALMSGMNFMVKPRDIYTAATELNKAMGFSRAETFFQDPGDIDWPQPEPDVKMLENQRRTVDDQTKNQIALLEAQTEAEEKRGLQDYRMKELDQKRELALMEMEVRKEIARMQSDAKDGEDDDGDPRESE